MLKRMISLFMCVAMLVSMLPVQAIALETEEPTELILETEPAAEETEVAEEETEPAEEVTEETESVEEEGSFDELNTPPVEETNPETDEEYPPVEEETEPTQEETGPAQEETEPAQEETEPAQEETEPAEEVAEPAEDPTAPSEEAPEPAEELEQIQQEPMMADAASGACGESVTWSFDADTGTLTISGTGAMTDYSEENPAPWSGYASEIQYLTIGSGVTTIGNYAFAGCSNLQSITIPGGVASIASGAFANCYNLLEMIFEGDAPTFAEDAFSDFYTIAKYNSENATWTKSVMQNYGGDIIWVPGDKPTSGVCGDDLVWEVDTYYQTLTISGSGPMYDYSLADPAPWMPFADSINYIYADESEMTAIGSYAFTEMDLITSIPLPAALEKIGEGAFAGCSGSLQTVTIPESIREIGKDAFAGCTKLSKVTFEGSAPEITGAVFSADMALVAFYPSADTSWTEAARNGFGGNVTWYGKNEDGTVTGTCGENLTWSFGNTTSGFFRVGQLVISGTGKMYDYSPENPAPWYGLGTSVQKLTISTGVECIGDYAFADLTKLGSGTGLSNSTPVAVTLPDSISAIGENAFTGCTSLKKLVFQGDAPSDMAQTIFSDDMTLVAYYPSENATWTEDVMKNYGGHIVWSAVDASGTELAGTCGTSANWYYDPASLTLTISGSGAMTNYTTWSMPKATPWDSWKTEIEKVIIETGITHLGNGAFKGLTVLKEVQIPDTVESIGTYVFNGCSSLPQLQLPDSVTQIGNYAFSGCSALTLHIPASVTSIGTWAVRGVREFSIDESNANYAAEDGLLLNKDKTRLLDYAEAKETYTIPSTVAEICEQAFLEHPTLTTITIPDSVETIGYIAFADCVNLTSVTLPKGSVVLGDYVFSGTGLTEITIPKGIAVIPAGLLFGCEMLESVTLEGDVSEIGMEAFYNCINLTSVSFKGDAPETIGENAFYDVNVIAYYPQGNASWTAEIMQNYGGRITWELQYTGICGNNLTWEFDEYTNNLTISGTGEMPDYSLENPAPWSKVSNNIFNLTIEAGVTSIGAYAFYGLGGLGLFWEYNIIVLPETIETIGENAFSGCMDKVSISFLGNAPEFAETVFSEDMTVLAHYQDGDATWIEDVKKDYGGNVSWYHCHKDGRPIEGRWSDTIAWQYSVDLATLTICGSGATPDGLEMPSAPWGIWWNEIAVVAFESGITNVNGNHFGNYPNLKYIEIPDTVVSIGDFVFRDCINLDLFIPASVSSIGMFAVENVKSLTIDEANAYYAADNGLFLNKEKTKIIGYATAQKSYVIPETVVEIGEDAFNSHLIMETITIPESVKTIGNNAFWSCYKLTAIDLPSSLITIGEQAFAHGYLTEIVIPENVERLEYGAFWGSDTLEAVVFEDKPTEIGSGAFAICDALTSIRFNADAPDIVADDAFEGVTATVYYPENNTTWTADIMQDYGGSLTWEIWEIPTEGACGDNLTWNFYEYGALSIYGSGEMTDYSIGKPAPWSEYADVIYDVYIESTVTSIGNYAFAGFTELYQLELPVDLARIGKSAFSGCNNLTELAIPAGIEQIESDAFKGCTNLSVMMFEGDMPVFADTVFSEDMTVTVYYPEDDASWTETALKDYGGKVYWYSYNSGNEISGTCGENLNWKFGISTSRLTISGTGEMVNYSPENPAPWQGLAPELWYLTIDDGVTSIGNYAFAGLHQLGYSAWMKPNAASSISLPDSLTKIGEYAFSGCDVNLKTFTVPAGITEIGKDAFAGCTKLTKVIFQGQLPVLADTLFSEDMILNAYYPYGDTSWTEDAKKNYGGNVSWFLCDEAGTALEGVVSETVTWHYDPVSESLSIRGNGAIPDFSGWGSKVPWDAWKTYVETVEIETGITYIGSRAFYGFTALQNITIPETVETIGASAFSNCSSITKIQLPDGITNIKNYTFYNCTSLTELIIPDSVTSVGDYAFQNCTALSLNIPAGVGSIGYRAVRGVKALTVDTANETYAAENGLLLNKEKTTVLDYAVLQDSYEIPGTVTAIGEEAFCDHPNLTSISLPANVASLGYAAFAGCYALEKVIVEGKLSEIAEYAFASCSSLVSIRFKGDAPETVNDYAFDSVAATAYYPVFNFTWTDALMQNYGGTLTWIPAVEKENTMALEVANLEGQTSVWIDGGEYAVTVDGETAYVDLPDSNAKTMVVYTYGESNGKSYPTGMKVWTLSNTDGFYTASHALELDNILGYEGCSIRITGKQGIRMITSIEEADKDALTGAGLAGYTLVEYGTAIAWADQISSNKPLILGKSYVSSNFAYSKAEGKDPIFAYEDDRIHYTNVLVGFTLDQCKDDIAMRPYMILADAEGNEITLYGGIVERSIGYIAAENHDTFEAGSEANAYVWEIITHVYGEDYVPAA